MPVDKFGRMSDTKTKDTGVSLTYINNNYVRSDGETPLTGSLNMRGNTIYNVADPVNPQDVVTKVYVDNTKGSGVIGRKTKDGVSIKENLDFLGKQKIKNLPEPVDEKDAVTKKYIDEKDAVTKKYVDDKTKNLFIDKNDNIAFGLNVDMEGNKIFSLPEPEQDNEPATKKYVDDLQTHYIDKRGNVRFDRNINVSNNRIFALKDPKKDYEATNKKYVDDSITKRLQEEKDNFLPQDPATKEYVDEAIKGLAGGDLLVSKEGVFIKANGHYRATAPLDIDNHKMENLREPLEDGDAVNKKYVDGIVEDLTLKQGLIRENGGFNLVDSYINMNFNNIRNVGNPKHEADAVPRSFVNDMVKKVEEKVDDMVKKVEEKVDKRKQLIVATASYYGDLIKDTFQFSFGGGSLQQFKTEKFNGFLMPYSGYIKNFVLEDFGLKIYYSGDIISHIEKEYGFLVPVPYFTLILLKTDSKIEELGVFYIRFVITSYEGPKINYGYYYYEPIPGKESYKINKYDILNIRSELTTTRDKNLNVFNFDKVVSDGNVLDKRSFDFKYNYQNYNYFPYLASILIELDPL